MLILPRPCRYSDLTAAACRGEVPSVAIVVDVSFDAVQDALEHWREVLPTSPLKLLAYSFNKEQVESFTEVDKNSELVAVIIDKFFEETAANARGSLVWATCAAYDSSGVYIKTDIEKALIAVMRMDRAIYLAHDPNYRIIRHFDSRGLHDRVFNRPWRKKFYRRVWQAACAFAWLAARLPFMRSK